MNALKEKLPVILGILIFLTLSGMLLYVAEYKEEYYYTRINNDKVERLATSDNMKFQYTLTSYNEKGHKKKITFKTSRKLREGAYLKLKILSLTGVNSWEEVGYNHLPEKVKDKYQVQK